MKKLFALTMLISFAMVCSCQKQGSAAEQQLAQRNAELDAREKALDEREKALDERRRDESFAERKRAITNIPKTPADVQRQTPDPAQVQAERDRRLQQLPAQWDADRDKRIQQLPAEVRALIPDPAQVQAGRDKRRQKRLAERQRQGLSSDPASLSGKANKQVYTQPEAASPPQLAYPGEVTSPPQLAPLSVYPQPEAASPSPSPTPQ